MYRQFFCPQKVAQISAKKILNFRHPMELHNGEISCSAIRKHTFKIDYKIKQ
jgi:hypothetical protein